MAELYPMARPGLRHPGRNSDLVLSLLARRCLAVCQKRVRTRIQGANVDGGGVAKSRFGATSPNISADTRSAERAAGRRARRPTHLPASHGTRSIHGDDICTGVAHTDRRRARPGVHDIARAAQGAYHGKKCLWQVPRCVQEHIHIFRLGVFPVR